jgi:hypothetical protein
LEKAEAKKMPEKRADSPASGGGIESLLDLRYTNNTIILV